MPVAEPQVISDLNATSLSMATSLGRARLPVSMIEVELSEPLPRLDACDASTRDEGPRREEAVMMLVRLHRAPVGLLAVRISPVGVQPSSLAEQIWRACGPAISSHMTRDGLPAPDGPVPDGLRGHEVPPCRARRARVLASAPPVSVVIATRDRPDELLRCLASLRRVDYPSFEIVVVDNDPETDDTAHLIQSDPLCAGVRYVREMRRGLAAAHNRGIEVCSGKIIAFTDDDVLVDSDWLAALVEGFAITDSVAAVTGLIHPAELRTRTQVLLEQHGGFAKGFAPTVFDLHDHRPADPLYPFTAGQFGSGANMAFDAEVLRDMGGFDPSMGTGTPARGGDDLAAFFSVVASGRRLVYQPGAIVYHFHRPDPPALARQAFGYGVGLGAYLTNAIVHNPSMALRSARAAGAAFRSTVRLGSDRNLARYDGWPRELSRLERRGIALGPAAYAKSAWRARRAARPRRRP